VRYAEKAEAEDTKRVLAQFIRQDSRRWMMNKIDHRIYGLALILGISSLSPIGISGYSFAGDQIPSQDRILQLEASAAQYAREAERISPLEDTKGFRRGALKMAAGSLQRQAAELRQLSTDRQRQADSMMTHQKER
jgi:hypothetical protein